MYFALKSNNSYVLIIFRLNYKRLCWYLIYNYIYEMHIMIKRIESSSRIIFTEIRHSLSFKNKNKLNVIIKFI